MDVAGDTLRVAVHVGSNCQADALELAAHARHSGVAAIAVAPPSYFKPATVKDLVDFCALIAAEVEPLPFYYYHIPSMTGVSLPMSEFLYEARFRIPNLRGLKFSHDNLVDLQGCASLEKGAYDVLFGCDEALLAGLCLGVRGAVGCTYNFAGRHYQRLIRVRIGRHRGSTGSAVRGNRDDQNAHIIRLHGRVEGRHVAHRCRLRASSASASKSHASSTRRPGRQAGSL